MNGLPSFPSLRALKLGTATVAAFATVLGMLPPLSAQEPENGAVPTRETIVFEGIRIGFPKGEADVVEALKPALLEFRRERQRMVAEEEEALADAVSNLDLAKRYGEQIAGLMAREPSRERLQARVKLLAGELPKLAAAWRKWSGDISEVQLWAASELKPFQTRPDGGDDAGGTSLRFPQISFMKKGAQFSLSLPFLGGPGLDLMRKLGEETEPLRLDFPLFYKPGESPEKIAEMSRELLGQLAPQLRKRVQTEIGGLLAAWLFEHMLLGEIEAQWVDARTARDTALAEGLARNLLFVQFHNREDEAKKREWVASLFSFGQVGSVVLDMEKVLAAVEAIDPLAPVDAANVAERTRARNLIALTLIRIAKNDGVGNPIFHKFKEAGIAIPEARFDTVTFTTAVDEAYGEKGFFRRMLAEQQKEAAAELRKIVARRTEEGKPETKPAPATAAPALPNRESAKYDGLTLAFPPELKGAMAILGPQCAKALANARAFAAKLKSKSEKPAALEVTDEDIAAYGTYGLEARAETLRMFAAAVPVVADATAMLVLFFSGDRVTIWFKEDLMALLKAGTEVPGFSLNPDGESVTWGFERHFPSEDFRRLSREGKDIAAEMQKRMDALPPLVLPMVVKRADLAAKLDDPEATAAAIREGERGIFGLLLSAEKEPLKESDLEGLNRPLMSREQAWFMVAHEAAEDAIVSSTIASADRRWFCDGMANWIAIRDVDRRFGKGKGAEAFAKNYDAQEMKKLAGEVNLIAWPAEEDIDNGRRPQVANVEAHYYFATLVIEKACEGRGEDFVKRWLEEIRRTPPNRTNSGTILAAYRKLTGRDLAAILAEAGLSGAFPEAKGAAVLPGMNDLDEFHRRGVEKVNKGDLDGALAEFTRAIEMSPKNPSGYCNRGSVRLLKGDLEAAMTDYNRAIEVDPKYSTAFCGRGNARHLKGDVEGALADFTRAIEVDPDDASGYGGRGGVKYQSGDLDGALADLNRALEIDPKDTGALSNRSKARNRKGDLDGEIADCTALMELRPKDTEAVGNRGAARHRKSDFDGAIADSNRAIEIDPKYAPAYNTRGASKHSKGDFAGAIADAARAIELDPKYVSAYINRGIAKWETDDHDGAIADFNRAIELDPKDAIAYGNRGNPRQGKGDLDGAIADYTRAIELDSKYEEAYSNRGAVLFSKGDVKGAIADATRAIELDPKSSEAWNNRGAFKRATPDLEGAIADYRRALELNPKYAGAWKNLAAARAAKGELDGALADYGRAIEIDPKFADAWHDRGAVRSQKGDLEGAIADLSRVAEIEPENAKNLYDRGMLRKAHGEIEGAVADFSRVLELNPKSDSAYAGRAAARTGLNDLDGAIADYDRAIELNPKLARAHFNRGVAHYLKQNWQNASADFDADGRQGKPGEYGALLACVVRTRMGQGEAGRNGLRAWQEKRRDAKRDDWVSKLGSFLLGALDEAALLQAAESPDAKKAGGQRCEACYYAGMQRLAAGQKAEAADCFRKCVATQQKAFTETTLASAELKWLAEK